MKQIVTYLSVLFGTFSAAYAQSTLSVDCYNSNSLYNSYSIDGQVVEYANYAGQLAFYVAVIDPETCTAWGTNYNGANPDHSFGNFNENDTYRQRVEYFFAFSMDDSLQLEGMKNMLQTIPAGHSIIIYTPIAYTYADVNAVNANLTQELESRWVPFIIQGNDIMVLYGEQGNANSYVEEITQDNGKVSFNTTICNSLSVKKEAIDSKLILKQEGTTFSLNPDLKIEELQIVDATGKQVSFVKTDNSIQLTTGISAGVYVFQGIASGKIYRSKQMIAY